MAVPVLLNTYLSYLYQENINYFETSKSLDCFNKSARFIVEKNTGWRVREKDFVKNDIALRVIDCKEY